MNEYDPRYLAGILFFNAHDFFEAHEVWEEAWAASYGVQRRFYQGLIQAAVGLCHFGNGNLNGAIKLYRSSREYMQPCGDSYMGLDLGEFWRQMEVCFASLLGPEPPPAATRPAEDKLPKLSLSPAPENWPDPEEYLPEEE
jgi:hypothetical protein